MTKSLFVIKNIRFAVKNNTAFEIFKKNMFSTKVKGHSQVATNLYCTKQWKYSKHTLKIY